MMALGKSGPPPRSSRMRSKRRVIMEKRTKGKVKKADEGLPFKKMNRHQKVVFILKLSVCIVTFGLVFPHVMSD
jgi:hypothetical protein